MATALIPGTLNVPGPRPLLRGYGNLFQVVRDPVRVMGQLFRQYGPIASLAPGAPVRLFSSLPHIEGVVFVVGPELLRQVSTQHAVYHRRQMTGGLTPKDPPKKRVETYRDQMVALAEQQIAGWAIDMRRDVHADVELP